MTKTELIQKLKELVGSPRRLPDTQDVFLVSEAIFALSEDEDLIAVTREEQAIAHAEYLEDR